MHFYSENSSRRGSCDIESKNDSKIPKNHQNIQRNHQARLIDHRRIHSESGVIIPQVNVLSPVVIHSDTASEASLAIEPVLSNPNLNLLTSMPSNDFLYQSDTSIDTDGKTSINSPQIQARPRHMRNISDSSGTQTINSDRTSRYLSCDETDYLLKEISSNNINNQNISFDSSLDDEWMNGFGKNKTNAAVTPPYFNIRTNDIYSNNENNNNNVYTPSRNSSVSENSDSSENVADYFSSKRNNGNCGNSGLIWKFNTNDNGDLTEQCKRSNSENNKNNISIISNEIKDVSNTVVCEVNDKDYTNNKVDNLISSNNNNNKSSKKKGILYGFLFMFIVLIIRFRLWIRAMIMILQVYATWSLREVNYIGTHNDGLMFNLKNLNAPPNIDFIELAQARKLLIEEPENLKARETVALAETRFKWGPQLNPKYNKEEEDYKVPPIIHHVMINWNKPIPETWKQAADACKQIHPDYVFMDWDDESAESFIREEHPDFYSTWVNYKYPIQRADSLRYLLLYTYGGIYLDMDLQCRRSLDPLRKFNFVSPEANPVGITNAFMISSPKNEFMKSLVKDLANFDHWYFIPYGTVMFSTGCMFTSAKYTLWSNKILDDIKVLGGKKNHISGRVTTPLFTHFGASSWHSSDVRFINKVLNFFGLSKKNKTPNNEINPQEPGVPRYIGDDFEEEKESNNQKENNDKADEADEESINVPIHSNNSGIHTFLFGVGVTVIAFLLYFYVFIRRSMGPKPKVSRE